MSKRNHPPLFTVRLEALKLAVTRPFVIIDGNDTDEAAPATDQQVLATADAYVEWLLKDLPEEDCGCGGKGAEPADDAVKARQSLVDMHLEKVLETTTPGVVASTAAKRLVEELRHNGYNTIGQVALGFGDFTTIARTELKGFFRVYGHMALLETSGSVESQASWIQTGTVSVTVQRLRDLED